MEVTIDSRPVQCTSEDLQSFNTWWQETTGDIFQQGRLLYQVSIDGVPYFDGYETHIIQHYDRIEKIELYTKTEEEALKESISELYAYNRKLIDASDQVSTAFYGEPDPEQWGVFAQYVEGLQWLSQSLQFIQALAAEKAQFAELQQPIADIQTMMQEKVEMLEQASDNKDYTLMGDIIQYEFSEILTKIEQVFGGRV